jgi:hypothetical protein
MIEPKRLQMNQEDVVQALGRFPPFVLDPHPSLGRFPPFVLDPHPSLGRFPPFVLDPHTSSGRFPPFVLDPPPLIVHCLGAFTTGQMGCPWATFPALLPPPKGP